MLKSGANAVFRSAATRLHPRGRWAPVQMQAQAWARAPRHPRAASTRLFATTADDVAKVTSAIAAQGEEIRKLKADKAPKDAIAPAVEALLKLKKEYEALTGTPFDPPKESKDDKPKPAPAPAPAPKAKAKEPAPAAAAEPADPAVRADYYASSLSAAGIGYGDFDLMASQGETGRVFAPVEALGTAAGPQVGETVWVRGRVASVRAKGNACFMVLRSKSFYTVQACHFKDADNPEESKKLIKFAGGLPLESIVDIQGEVVAADVKSCTQATVELKIQKVYAVSRAPPALPFLLEDAARPQAEIDASQGSERPFPTVPQDMRLNNR